MPTYSPVTLSLDAFVADLAATHFPQPWTLSATQQIRNDGCCLIVRHANAKRPGQPPYRNVEIIDAGLSLGLPVALILRIGQASDNNGEIGLRQRLLRAVSLNVQTPVDRMP